VIQIWSRSPQEFEAAKSSKSTVRDFESRDLEVSQITLTFFADNTDIFESVYFRLSFYLVTGYVMRRMIATLGWIWTPRRALRGGISKVNFEQSLSSFGDKCP
jgi:hypothetical protein